MALIVITAVTDSNYELKVEGAMQLTVSGTDAQVIYTQIGGDDPPPNLWQTRAGMKRTIDPSTTAYMGYLDSTAISLDYFVITSKVSAEGTKAECKMYRYSIPSVGAGPVNEIGSWTASDFEDPPSTSGS